jgi:hypothetical protein
MACCSIGACCTCRCRTNWWRWKMLKIDVKSRAVAAASATVLLSGCALFEGSPAHTSSLNSNQIRNVDNYTLCVAAAPREFYSPSSTVMMEVQKRGLNCRSIYQYVPTPPRPVIQQNNKQTQISCTRMGRFVDCTTD